MSKKKGEAKRMVRIDAELLNHAGTLFQEETGCDIVDASAVAIVHHALETYIRINSENDNE